MDAKYYAYNQTRGCFVSGALAPVDAGLEPLRVLKVLIEGLAPGAKSGLWLTHFRSVPVARTLSPFDLIYLDSELRVVHAVELSTDGEFTPFTGQPASALVLPYQSIASTQTRTGDQLIIRMADQPERAAASSERATEPIQKPGVSAGVQPDLLPAGATHHATADERTSSPLEQFLAQQSAISARRDRAHPNAKSLLELSPTESAPAVGESSAVLRPSIHAVPSPSSFTRESRSGPTRAQRIAPPPTGAPPAGDGMSQVAPSLGDAESSTSKPKSASWKIAPFPLRNGAAPKPLEPQFRPSDIEEYRPQAQEKASLLMRVLRLQFLKGDGANRQSIEGPMPGARDQHAFPKSTVPDWAMRFLRWLYPELEIATAAEVAVQPSYNARTKFQHELSPSLDLQFFKWLYPELRFRRPQLDTAPSDRRLSARLPKPGLVAYYFTGGPPAAHKIGDISVTGFYMHTDERWLPGTIIRMTLQMALSRDDETPDTLTIHSRVVRWGPDGEGFEFVLAGFLDEPLPISYRLSERPRRRLNS